MKNELTALKKVLRNDPPPAICALPDDVLQALADDILAAQRGQKRQLIDSYEHTLRAIPFPLRPVARKVLLG